MGLYSRLGIYIEKLMNFMLRESSGMKEIIFEIQCKEKRLTILSLLIKLNLLCTLENTRLSIGIDKNIPLEDIKLSDHFITYIGRINFNEILAKGYLLKTLLPFVFIRNNLIPICDKKEQYGFAEFRINTNSSNKIISVYKKILCYVFNRTGIMFLKPYHLNVLVQLKTENMIGIEESNKFSNSLSLIGHRDSNIDQFRKPN